MKYTITSVGWLVTADVHWLDDGVDIGVFGGVRTHTGEMTMIGHYGKKTIPPVDEKTAAVSERWAEILYARWRVPVAVRCGIGLDGFTPDQINKILNDTDLLLFQVINGETPEAGDL